MTHETNPNRQANMVKKENRKIGDSEGEQTIELKRCSFLQPRDSRAARE